MIRFDDKTGKVDRRWLYDNNDCLELIDALDVAVAALQWINGASDVLPDRCSCGRPTGIRAIFSHSERTLRQIGAIEGVKQHE